MRSKGDTINNAMLQKLFSNDNLFWRVMGILGDIFLLNILWIITSIPIITIGASSTAVYYALFKIKKNEGDGTIRMFFRSFRQNFVEASIIWIGTLLIITLLCFDYYFFMQSGFPLPLLGTIARIVLIAVALVLIILVLYVWPVLSRFDNDIIHTLRFAINIAIANLPKTALILITDSAIFAIECVIIRYLTIAAPLIGITGFPLYAWVNVHFFQVIFEGKRD